MLQLTDKIADAVDEDPAYATAKISMADTADRGRSPTGVPFFVPPGTPHPDAVRLSGNSPLDPQDYNNGFSTEAAVALGLVVVGGAGIGFIASQAGRAAMIAVGRAALTSRPAQIASSRPGTVVGGPTGVAVGTAVRAAKNQIQSEPRPPTHDPRLFSPPMGETALNMGDPNVTAGYELGKEGWTVQDLYNFGPTLGLPPEQVSQMVSGVIVAQTRGEVPTGRHPEDRQSSSSGPQSDPVVAKSGGKNTLSPAARAAAMLSSGYVAPQEQSADIDPFAPGTSSSAITDVIDQAILVAEEEMARANNVTITIGPSKSSQPQPTPIVEESARAETIADPAGAALSAGVDAAKAGVTKAEVAELGSMAGASPAEVQAVQAGIDAYDAGVELGEAGYTPQDVQDFADMAGAGPAEAAAVSAGVASVQPDVGYDAGDADFGGSGADFSAPDAAGADFSYSP